MTNPAPHDLFRRRDAETNDSVHMDAQSVAFYADVSAFAVKHLGVGVYSLLDIGPRTGAGLAMLRIMHHPKSYAGVKFDPVVGVDIDPMFKAVAETGFPDITAIHGEAEAYSGPRRWDVVMSSHTVEHVDEPEEFLLMLRRLAKKAAIVACPFEEEDLIKWHKNRIGYKLLTKCGFWEHQVYRSNHWFNSPCVIAMAAPLSN
ncbi:SAM-dependent methyltransferase [Aminobacter niigataensis]|uniref:SAM-dependent methyltransferase n=1 Tax=Aminobacter niigataensis TaxID=83265 RepID=A0ABR6KXI6_9HYPH|nr:methyltransferase domain-containing protein [Aminobacter niigataensis]MBB4649233.1 SAM-dependent methyltransferase [Aminobacter niigataensis]